jgi:hypothetical protein
MSKIYLSVSSTEANSSELPAQMPAKDFEQQSRIVDAVNVLIGRKEVEAAPELVAKQISDQINLVREAVVKSEQENADSLKIQSVKLGLTVTVGGNIGIASTEAEASIEVVFGRD